MVRAGVGLSVPFSSAVPVETQHGGVVPERSTDARRTVTLNGFAASMTAADAAKLAGTAGVKAVIKDEKRKLDTTRTSSGTPPIAAARA